MTQLQEAKFVERLNHMQEDASDLYMTVLELLEEMPEPERTLKKALDQLECLRDEIRFTVYALVDPVDDGRPSRDDED